MNMSEVMGETRERASALDVTKLLADPILDGLRLKSGGGCELYTSLLFNSDEVRPISVASLGYTQVYHIGRGDSSMCEN